jgi:hypothetical protein
MQRYRIGYLNPWSQAAENHASVSLAIAARRLGHELVPVTSSDEVVSANLDYVIAVASTQARTTHVPTFASIHEPRLRWWENESYFWNLLTYDGYLTISDSLAAFIRSFCAGFDKDTDVGQFFSTPQRQQVRADIAGLVRRNALNLCYFGTNWDPRSRPLFRELARRPYMQIRGPAKSWKDIAPSRYYGSVPFDGQSVQTVYAANGAGLVVHSRNHTLDDVVSNRIFEICSVGAVAIAPDMPWLRSNFGDTIHYFDPWASASRTSQRIDEIMESVANDPQGAAETAEAARAVFEKSFCAEVMIANTVRYYETWRHRTDMLRRPEAEQPRIDVIMRVGGRSVDVIKRAIRSIDSQTIGRFRIIFVRYKPIDLDSIVSASWRHIEGFQIVDCPAGNRAKTMSAGLGAVELPQFAILDDDDFWLPDHVSSMWRYLKVAPQESGFAYCGCVYVDERLANAEMGSGSAPPPSASASDSGVERRRLGSIAPASGNIWDIVGRFGSINFIASSALLRGLDLYDWRNVTAEDTITVCHLLSGADRIEFTWRATVCISQSGGGSGFREQSLQRKEDVLEAFLRIGPGITSIERKLANVPSPVWPWLGTRIAEVFEAKSKLVFLDQGRLVLEEGMLSTSIHDRDDVLLKEVEFSPLSTHLEGGSHFSSKGSGHVLEVRPLMQAWAYAATIDLRGKLWDVEEQWVVMEFDNLDGTFGIGLIEAATKNFYSRMETPRRSTPVELWLHVGKKDAVSEVVIQNWATYEAKKATLRKIWAARRKSEDQSLR